ncbi:hypothetical protein G4L39_01090 [Limisphaera ngatamarikiensis]|uniref:CBM-cenC domain-containing protein n=1 Tax=Limisphaera ngatamarikiensis TaxID=1324935 RepID=A0A6M1RK24_9BACT|nr:hypothetical protein [Limisphaera ngatamarikiensis]
MRTRNHRTWHLLLPWLIPSALLVAGPGHLENGGFENGLTGWRPLWTRQTNAGRLQLDPHTVHTGQSAARIEHRGNLDWSFEPALQLSVVPGQVVVFQAWTRKTGSGTAYLCASLWAPDGRVMEWTYGSREIHNSDSWQLHQVRWVVPDGVARLQPRFIGTGTATLWIDDVNLEHPTENARPPDPNLPPALTWENPLLTVTLITSNVTLHVTDRRTGHTWHQVPLHRELRTLCATPQPRGFQLVLDQQAWDRTLHLTLEGEPEKPEFTIELSSPGPMQNGPLRFPHPFESQPGQYLVIPMNEGISYPVEDPDVDLFRLVTYGGHGLCMAFWGVTDGTNGYAAIFKTADDAAIQIHRRNGRLTVAPEWDAQTGQFGYPRRLRYIFFNQGGHVAIAKRYRRYAREIGRFRTLAEKRQQNPHVDLLIGAVNVWCWDPDPVSIVREMQQTGIERILWSQGQPPETLRKLNELGVLTGRYDIYQDVMDPARFPHLKGIHPDWPTEAWPDDLIRDATGRWIPGWEVETRDGTRIPCGVLCDSRALHYARPRISNELATHPYRARFIDTTTASPWRECYDPAHPMTRSDSRHHRMQLLQFVSTDMNLVTGSETGHDAAVPYVHYFEGMLSLGPYRVPDAGRDMARIWTEVPPQLARYQLGWRYRLPLWELVYHDCVVAQWYWGDYSNKLPALWDLRDLFNLLYGTPPMFMFDRKLWHEQKQRFVRSYRTVCPVARRVGYTEMTDHRFLSPDRAVQQTRFANGVTITVNFSDSPRRTPDGSTLPPLGYRVDINPN